MKSAYGRQTPRPDYELTCVEPGSPMGERLRRYWECIACPPGVIHRFQNDGPEPVYMQVMLGCGRLEAMGYADDELYRRRDVHLGR